MEDDEFGHLYDQHGDFRDQEEYEEYTEFADPPWVRDFDDIIDAEQLEIEEPDSYWDDDSGETNSSRTGSRSRIPSEWWGYPIPVGESKSVIACMGSQIWITRGRVDLYMENVSYGPYGRIPVWTVPRLAIIGMTCTDTYTSNHLVLHTRDGNELHAGQVNVTHAHVATKLFGEFSSRVVSQGETTSGHDVFIPCLGGPLIISEHTITLLPAYPTSQASQPDDWPRAKLQRANLEAVRKLKSDTGNNFAPWNVTVQSTDGTELHISSMRTTDVEKWQKLYPTEPKSYLSSLVLVQLHYRKQ